MKGIVCFHLLAFFFDCVQTTQNAPRQHRRILTAPTIHPTLHEYYAIDIPIVTPAPSPSIMPVFYSQRPTYIHGSAMQSVRTGRPTLPSPTLRPAETNALPIKSPDAFRSLKPSVSPTKMLSTNVPSLTPASLAPTTVAPTTLLPTTSVPTTLTPTTPAPTTSTPTTQASTTSTPTIPPTKIVPTTQTPTAAAVFTSEPSSFIQYRTPSVFPASDTIPPAIMRVATFEPSKATHSTESPSTAAVLPVQTQSTAAPSMPPSTAHLLLATPLSLTTTTTSSAPSVASVVSRPNSPLVQDLPSKLVITNSTIALHHLRNTIPDSEIALVESITRTFIQDHLPSMENVILNIPRVTLLRQRLGGGTSSSSTTIVAATSSLHHSPDHHDRVLVSTAPTTTNAIVLLLEFTIQGMAWSTQVRDLESIDFTEMVQNVFLINQDFYAARLSESSDTFANLPSEKNNNSNNSDLNSLNDQNSSSLVIPLVVMSAISVTIVVGVLCAFVMFRSPSDYTVDGKEADDENCFDDGSINPYIEDDDNDDDDDDDDYLSRAANFREDREMMPSIYYPPQEYLGQKYPIQESRDTNGPEIFLKSGGGESVVSGLSTSLHQFHDDDDTEVGGGGFDVWSFKSGNVSTCTAVERIERAAEISALQLDEFDADIELMNSPLKFTRFLFSEEIGSTQASM